ncbi:hypothetical protein Tco_1554773, partial [Tanacetum coccineum]
VVRVVGNDGMRHDIHEHPLGNLIAGSPADLSNLASLAKTYSFGRAGLMSLAGCVADAAFGISKPANNEAKKFDEAPREMKSDTDSTYYNDKAALLDVFRFIIGSNKQHFNPNYHLKG